MDPSVAYVSLQQLTEVNVSSVLSRSLYFLSRLWLFLPASFRASSSLLTLHSDLDHVESKQMASTLVVMTLSTFDSVLV